MTNEAKQHFYKHMTAVAVSETEKIKQNMAEEAGQVSGINFMLDEMKKYLHNVETESEKKESKEPVKTKKRIIIDIGKVKALRNE